MKGFASFCAIVVLPWLGLAGAAWYNTSESHCTQTQDWTFSGKFVLVESCKGALGMQLDKPRIIRELRYWEAE